MSTFVKRFPVSRRWALWRVFRQSGARFSSLIRVQPHNEITFPTGLVHHMLSRRSVAVSRIWLCGSLVGVATVKVLFASFVSLPGTTPPRYIAFDQTRLPQTAISLRQCEIPSAFPSAGDRVRVRVSKSLPATCPGKGHIVTRIIPRHGFLLC